MRRRTTLVPCLAAAVAAALAAWPSGAGATYPGGNGRIVFARASIDAPGYTQIFTITQAGTELRRLTDGLAQKATPAYSASGKRIAFARSTVRPPYYFHIVVMQADGRQRRQLTHANADDSAPQFDPTGRTIVFERLGSLYSIRADGSHLKRLVRAGSEPAYSPDGRTIAYAGFADGDRGLFVMNADGTHRRQLTHDPQSAPDPAGHRDFLHVDRTPSFSPDGRRIVFVRQRHQCAEGGEVYVVNPDGTHLRAVTHDGEPCAAYSGPVFAPGGGRIAVSSLSALEVMRLDGTHRRILRAGRNQYHDPDWQPLPR